MNEKVQPGPNSTKRAQLGGIPLGPPLAAALYLLLMGSAILAVGFKKFNAGPWVFLAFTICFAGYRMALIRAKKYPPFKAFFQVGAAFLFFMLLVLRTAPPPGISDELASLFTHSDPKIRALAAEVAVHRPSKLKYTRLLVRALTDPDARVRQQAHRSLVEINQGQDAGDGDSVAGRMAWERRFP